MSWGVMGVPLDYDAEAFFGEVVAETAVRSPVPGGWFPGSFRIEPVQLQTLLEEVEVTKPGCKLDEEGIRKGLSFGS